jgi:hypothetical protein
MLPVMLSACYPQKLGAGEPLERTDQIAEIGRS